MPMEAAVFRLLFLPFLVTLAEEGGAFCRHARRGNAHASARDASAVVDSPCLAQLSNTESGLSAPFQIRSSGLSSYRCKFRCPVGRNFPKPAFFSLPSRMSMPCVRPTPINRPDQRRAATKRSTPREAATATPRNHSSHVWLSPTSSESTPPPAQSVEQSAALLTPIASSIAPPGSQAVYLESSPASPSHDLERALDWPDCHASLMLARWARRAQSGARIATASGLGRQARLRCAIRQLRAWRAIRLARWHKSMSAELHSWTALLRLVRGVWWAWHGLHCAAVERRCRALRVQQMRLLALTYGAWRTYIVRRWRARAALLHFAFVLQARCVVHWAAWVACRRDRRPERERIARLAARRALARAWSKWLLAADERSTFLLRYCAAARIADDAGLERALCAWQSAHSVPMPPCVLWHADVHQRGYASGRLSRTRFLHATGQLCCSVLPPQTPLVRRQLS